MISGARVAGVLVAVAFTGALAALSRVPYAEHEAGDALVRLAWRFRSDRVTRCRPLSADELAKLPRHMRQPEVCEGGLRPYRLTVEVDGVPRGDDTIRAAGATSDRPLFVFAEILVAPGEHRVRVLFEPVGSGEGGVVPAGSAGPVAPPPLRLDTAVTLGARQIGLITLDTDRGVLVVRSAPSGS